MSRFVYDVPPRSPGIRVGERVLRTVMPGVGLAVLAMATSSVARAQKSPPVRQLGRLERATPNSLALLSITTALATPDGQVLVNDVRGRRVVRLDSTLSAAFVIADTTGATANAYGSSWATLLRYRGDSALLLVPSTLSMFVIAPSGAMARTLAIPRPNEAQVLAAAVLGTVPAIDARGRLLYFGSIGVGSGRLLLRRGTTWLQDGRPTEIARQVMSRGNGWISPTRRRIDSAVIARVDLETRVVDTVATIRIPRGRTELEVDGAGVVTSIEATPDPLPVVDQWTVLHDGTIAIVRGSDYHIDWIDRAGRLTSTPKMPFDWERVDDARKAHLIDSAVANWQPASRDTARTSRGRGGDIYTPTIARRAPLSELPDYYPPIGTRSVIADRDDNLWIPTTKMLDGRPVYDVVNRAGEVVDRVQLPRYRTIAGFGPGVVYMGVLDGTGRARLERARIK